MNVALPVDRPEVTSHSTQGAWRIHLAAFAVAIAAILLLFHRDAADLVDLWLKSETFNHCLLIPPIIAWLVWQRLPELRRLEPHSYFPGLLIVAAGGASWLVGDAAMVSLVRYAGLVLMLQGAVIACLGKQVTRGLAFPLFYALFLIPAGEELVPPLQTLTARMSLFLLGLSGVPAHLDGIFITTPTGYFEVAEACSGVQFLIAMVAYGALVANLCFRSWKRRALFMAAAVLIPILANGVRAWATIFIAHHTTTDFAAGFDHIVFGWIFFAIVIALLMAGGWRFFDRKPTDPWFYAETLHQRHRRASHIWPAAAATLALAALPLGWSSAIASSAERAPAELRLPRLSGWTQVPATSGRAWEPHFAGAELIRMARYRDAAGQEVDLAIIWFARQEEGRELIGFGQGSTAPNGAWAWTADGPPPPGGKLERIASHGTSREVATFYRIGSIVTGSPVAVKLETMKARLLGGPQRAIAVMVSAETPADGASPRPAIDAFIQALGPIDALADAAQRPTKGGRSSS